MTNELYPNAWYADEEYHEEPCPECGRHRVMILRRAGIVKYECEKCEADLDMDREELFGLLDEAENFSNDEPIMDEYGQWIVPELDAINRDIDKIKDKIGEDRFSRLVDIYFNSNGIY